MLRFAPRRGGLGFGNSGFWFSLLCLYGALHLSVIILIPFYGGNCVLPDLVANRVKTFKRILREYASEDLHPKMPLFYRCGSCDDLISNMNEVFESALEAVCDDRSINTLNWMLDVARYYQKTRSGPNINAGILHVLPDAAQWEQERPRIDAAYSYLAYKDEGAFFYFHGLRYAPQVVRDYVKTRDIIDCGAYVGDSMAALSNYTTRRVVSYELMPESTKTVQKVVEILGEDRHSVQNRGLSNAPGWFNAGSGNRSSSRMRRARHSGNVRVTTLDAEVERLNLTVGFIKADIENSELPMLKGALKTLLRDRPVLSIAIYHSDQVWRVPAWIASIGGYTMTFHTEECMRRGWSEPAAAELRVFAVPESMGLCGWTGKKGK